MGKMILLLHWPKLVPIFMHVNRFVLFLFHFYTKNFFYYYFPFLLSKQKLCGFSSNLKVFASFLFLPFTMQLVFFENVLILMILLL